VDDIEDVITDMLFKIYVADHNISATTTFLYRTTATVVSNNILVINDAFLSSPMTDFLVVYGE